MSIAHITQLLILSAVWGASFLFVRVAVPYLGPVLLIEFRVGFAALFLTLVGWLLHKNLSLKKHWKHYVFLGLFNSAVPFLLFAYAAQSLTVSLLSILNATAPIWGVLIDSIWNKRRLTYKTILGLGLGITGVYILMGFDSEVHFEVNAYPAIIAALVAAFSYGIASTYAHSANKVEPFENAHGSMWVATLMIMPFLPFFPAVQMPTSTIMFSVVGLGVLSTGFAYILYFRLIAQIGAASALTVTYTIPFFAILWGYVFLGERIGWNTIVGACVVLLGTALVTHKKGSNENA